MSEDRFTLTNSVDSDEMPHHGALIWDFTVCKSTHLGVLEYKWILTFYVDIQIVMSVTVSQPS